MTKMMAKALLGAALVCGGVGTAKAAPTLVQGFSQSQISILPIVDLTAGTGDFAFQFPAFDPTRGELLSAGVETQITFAGGITINNNTQDTFDYVEGNQAFRILFSTGNGSQGGYRYINFGNFERGDYAPGQIISLPNFFSSALDFGFGTNNPQLVHDYLGKGLLVGSLHFEQYYVGSEGGKSSSRPPYRYDVTSLPFSDTVQATISARLFYSYIVPEPASLAALGVGAAAIVAARRRRG